MFIPDVESDWNEYQKIEDVVQANISYLEDAVLESSLEAFQGGEFSASMTAWLHDKEEISDEEALDAFDNSDEYLSREDCKSHVDEVIENLSCETREKIKGDEVAMREIFSMETDAMCKDRRLHPFQIQYMDNPY